LSFNIFIEKYIFSLKKKRKTSKLPSLKLKNEAITLEKRETVAAAHVQYVSSPLISCPNMIDPNTLWMGTKINIRLANSL